jgi:crotonyl-CoA reductase
MKDILETILSADATPADYAALPVPEHYRGITVHQDEVGMFEGRTSRDKDPRESLHLDEVPTPELGPGEALVAVMASAINYNTVWTSIFEPVPTFMFLQRYGRLSPLSKRHDLPYHVVGSDLSGVVLRTGPGVHAWAPGDEVVAHCLSVELESPDGHNDTMLDPEQRIWGFETNFGGLAELALVKSNQLMPKPAHLTWEEARAGQLDGVPPAGLAQRRRHEAGRRRAGVGRLRRAGVLCDAVRRQRRRDPGVRRVQRGQGRDRALDGRRADHRPQP